MLYDHRLNKAENINLAGLEEFSKIVSDLSSVLHSKFKKMFMEKTEDDLSNVSRQVLGAGRTRTNITVHWILVNVSTNSTTRAVERKTGFEPGTTLAR